MDNEIDYLVADENCKQAIKELMFDANRLKCLKNTEDYMKRSNLVPKSFQMLQMQILMGLFMVLLKIFTKSIH